MPARYHALILLAGFSSLRWGELVALRRCDVNVKAGTVRVTRKLIEVRGKMLFGPPKSKAGIRTVTVPEAAMGSLRSHLVHNVGTEPEALLFTGEKGALLRASNFRRAVHWDDACAEAGLPDDFHFHDTRHLGNLLAAETGASTRELMHRLGQSSMRAALIYQHATAWRDREIAKQMDLRLKMAIEEEDHDEGPDSDSDDGSAGVLVRVR